MLTTWVIGKLRPRALLMTRSNTAQQTLGLQRHRGGGLDAGVGEVVNPSASLAVAVFGDGAGQRV